MINIPTWLTVSLIAFVILVVVPWIVYRANAKPDDESGTFTRSTKFLVTGGLGGAVILWLCNTQAFKDPALTLTLSIAFFGLTITGLLYWIVDRK